MRRYCNASYSEKTQKVLGFDKINFPCNIDKDANNLSYSILQKLTQNTKFESILHGKV